MRRANSYRSSTKHRAFRLFGNVIRGFLHASLSRRILYVALGIGTFVLFLPWVSVQLGSGEVQHYSSFRLISGGVGFFILLVFVALLFVINVADDREHIKAKVSLVFREHSCILFAGSLVGIMCLMIFFSLLGYSNATTGNIDINTRTSGIVFELLVVAMILFAGVLNYKEGQRSIQKRIYVENASAQYASMENYDSIIGKDASDDESNMKLPI